MTDKKAIVYISQNAGAPRYGMIYGNYHHAKNWVDSGHDVTMISSSSSHARMVNPECKQFITDELIDGILYKWLRMPKNKSNNKILRIVNLLLFPIALYLFIGQLSKHRKKLDLVVCTTPNPLCIFAAKKLAKQRGAKLIIEVRDLWPLTLRELGGFSEKHPFLQLMAYAEKFGYANADRVVSVLEFAEPHMLSKGLKTDAFQFIPNGVEMSTDDPVDKLRCGQVAAIKKLKASGKFVLGYAGKIGVSNSVSLIIDAVEAGVPNDLVFVVCGQGELMHQLEERVRSSGLKGQVIFMGAIPKIYVNELISTFDCAVAAVHDKPIYRFGLSLTKLSEYMQCGVPVVYAANDRAKPVQKAGCGIECSPSNPLEIADAIKTVYDLSVDARSQMGQKGALWVTKHRNYKKLSQEYLDYV